MEIIKEVKKTQEVFSYDLGNFDFTDDKFKDLDSQSVLKIKSKDELKSIAPNLSDTFIDMIADKTFDADSLVIICYLHSEGKYFGKVVDENNESVQILAEWCDVCSNDDRTQYKIFNFIQNDDELEEIVNEMISKISPEELHATISLINYAYGRRKEAMKDDIAEKYIRTWAKNKAFMYLALGRNLIIKKDVVVQCKDEELKSMWNEHCCNFLFGRPLAHCNTESIVNNTIKLYQLKDLLESYLERCDCVEYRRLLSLIERNGSNTSMKLTKVIAKVFEDEKLNIELSKVLQGKSQKHTLCISIHPLDYLTCSMTKKWESCHRPTGMYQGGPISYMLDSATVMAYSSSDSMLLSESRHMDFDLFVDDNWKSFKWNNKKWRSLFYVNKNNFSATFYREYPSPIGNMFDELRSWYEELISSYVNEENVWEDRAMYYHLKDNTDLHYNDPVKFSGRTNSDKHLHHVSLPCVKFDDCIEVGHRAFSLTNGNLTNDRSLR